MLCFSFVVLLLLFLKDETVQDETRHILLLNFTWRFFYVVFFCFSEKDIKIFSPLQISHMSLCNCV